MISKEAKDHLPRWGIIKKRDRPTLLQDMRALVAATVFKEERVRRQIQDLQKKVWEMRDAVEPAAQDGGCGLQHGKVSLQTVH